MAYIGCVYWKIIKVRIALNETEITVPYNTISFIFKTERYNDTTTPNNMLIGTCIHMTNNIQLKSSISP